MLLSAHWHGVTEAASMQRQRGRGRRRVDPKAAVEGARHKKRRNQKRSEVEGHEIKQLEKLIQELRAPHSLSATPSNTSQVPASQAEEFDGLPISSYTKRALAESSFVTLTPIQKACLPQALCGKDVLGAAKTGSGKTLSFLIPVLETLYRARWSQLDGIGALIISPTRELALQIFDELRKVGKHHSVSAGLLIGGKSADEEAKFVTGINILVCAPGRLLHHMDSTPGFDCNNLQVLVLDEADRCLDMGFSKTMDAIIANLPTERQTMLFSATQSKRVSDLARLSLQDPEYIAVDAEATTATPSKLKQCYIKCELHTKMDLLWFFIKTHLKKRTIVFLSTCKQVKFVYEAFRKLRPGVPLAMLHGSMKQMKRFAVFYTFSQSDAMILFATDVAARGLDFPQVDWVVQADCPEDVDAYIHRVGRTARFTASGEALLFLMPSEEEAMLKALEEKKVPIALRTFSSRKVLPVKGQFGALLAEHDDLKLTAQAAFLTYMRSVYLNPRRDIFDVSKLDPEAYAFSMGLPSAPHQRAVKKMQKHSQQATTKGTQTAVAKEAVAVAGGTGWQSLPYEEAAEQVEGGNEENHEQAELDGSDSEQEGTGRGSGDARLAVEANGAEEESSEGEEGEDGDMLTVRRTDVLNRLADVEADLAQARLGTEATGTGKRKKRKKQKIQVGKGTGSLATGSKTVFDASGRALDSLEVLQSAREELNFETADDRFSAQKLIIQAGDQEDRHVDKRKRRERKLKKKLKKKEAAAEEQSPGAVVLGGGGDSAGEQSDQSDEEDMGREKPVQKARRAAGAYKGMADDDSDQPNSPVRAVKDMGLGDQEQLALRLLAGGM